MAVEDSVAVEVEHGSFAITSGDPDRPDLVDVTASFDGKAGIVAVPDGVLVASPQEFSTAVLTVHVLERQPALDADWPEVLEASLDVVGGAGLHYFSLGAVPAHLRVPDGRYDVRICGRGFVDFEWGDLDVDGEVVWRVQLWPRASQQPSTPRRVRRWEGPKEEKQVSADPSLPVAWQEIQRRFFAIREQLPWPWFTQEELRAARKHVGVLADQAVGASDMVLMGLGSILERPLRKPDKTRLGQLSAWTPQLERLAEHVSPPTQQWVSELVRVANACLAELRARGVATRTSNE